MEVILLERVHHLGKLGDTVKVKPGFGRNFLIPQGKAVPANAANVAAFEARRAELEKAEKEATAQAEQRAAKLNNVVATIKMHASEEGKLYGSVGTKEIAEAVTAAGVELHKSEVLLPDGSIHQLGEHEVALQLHNDVSAKITLKIETAE